MEPRRLQRTACPSCGSTSLRAWAPVRDHVSAVWFAVAQCTACTLVFLSDPPIAEDLSAFYDNPSGAVMHRSPPAVVRRARDLAMRGEVRKLARHVPAGAVVADIGAGDGSLVRVLRASGFRPLAVDIYPPEQWPHPEIAYARYDPGAPLAELLDDVGPVDAVTMRHVLEHVLDPVGLLARLAELDVATVSVVVPNIESRLARRQGTDWYYWDPPRHLTFFSPATLRTTAARAGYEVTSLRKVGLDEVVTAAHRRSLLAELDRGAPGPRGRFATLTRPTGLLASASSALAAPLGAATIHAVLARR